MTEQEKELLLKDLCGRLPYGVKAQYFDAESGRYDIDTIDGIDLTDKPEILISQYGLKVDAIKPYLRPMSSMNEEEKKELKDIIYFGYPSDDYDKCGHRGVEIISLEYDDWERIEFDFEDYYKLENWLNEHHFDYRELIEKGLALEAPEWMYNI